MVFSIFSDFQKPPISPYSYYFLVSTGYSKIERISCTQIYLGIFDASLAMSVTYQKVLLQATDNNFAISGSPRSEKP